MEDFSQLCHALRHEYNARSVPFSLRDYVRMCVESLADLISEDRPERFHSAMGHFFASLYGGNELFNRLPVASRNNLNSVTIGIPPRRLFELLNDFARVINELSLLEMSPKTVRSSLQENGFPYRPNEFLSLLEQLERLDWGHNVANAKWDKANRHPWTPEAENEARRLYDDRKIMSAKSLQETLSVKRQVAQSLWRYITGKPKKPHNRN